MFNLLFFFLYFNMYSFTKKKTKLENEAKFYKKISLIHKK